MDQLGILLAFYALGFICGALALELVWYRRRQKLHDKQEREMRGVFGHDFEDPVHPSDFGIEEPPPDEKE